MYALLKYKNILFLRNVAANGQPVSKLMSYLGIFKYNKQSIKLGKVFNNVFK
jgi:hypothetical protein